MWATTNLSCVNTRNWSVLSSSTSQNLRRRYSIERIEAGLEMTRECGRLHSTAPNRTQPKQVSNTAEEPEGPDYRRWSITSLKTSTPMRRFTWLGQPKSGSAKQMSRRWCQSILKGTGYKGRSDVTWQYNSFVWKKFLDGRQGCNTDMHNWLPKTLVGKTTKTGNLCLSTMTWQVQMLSL